jgi:hypothetical protein
MKAIRVLGILAFGALLALGVYAANDAPKAPAPVGKKAQCCVRAATDDKTCTHACCVEAAKANKNCERCGGTNTAEAPAPGKS